MHVWHKMATNLPPTFARIALSQIMAERVDIYPWVPPHGDSTPIETASFTVDDYIPSMEDIEWSVYWLRRYHSGGTPCMRVEHLQYWLAAVTW